MEHGNISASLTVNRWHKATERLRNLIDECIQVVKHAFKAASAQAYLGPAQIAEYERLRGRGLEAKEKLGYYLEMRNRIRNAIAMHNASSGIHELLAEIDSNHQQIKLFREILKYQHAGRVPIECLQTVFLDAGNGEKKLEAAISLSSWNEDKLMDELFLISPSKTDGVDVAMLTPAEVEALKQKQESLEKRNYQLHDMLADANLERISIEIPGELAKRLAIV